MSKQETSKKHYSSTEKTGLSTTEEKERSILNELYWNYALDVHFEVIPKEKAFMRRYYLRLAIGKALSELLKKPIEKSTIYHFIDYMLNMGFIEQNPDSHITVNDTILPDNMTKYFLDAEKIQSRVRELNNSTKGEEGKVMKEDLYANLQRLMELDRIEFIYDEEIKRSLESVEYDGDEFQGEETDLTEAIIRACWGAKEKRYEPRII